MISCLLPAYGTIVTVVALLASVVSNELSNTTSAKFISSPTRAAGMTPDGTWIISGWMAWIQSRYFRGGR